MKFIYLGSFLLLCTSSSAIGEQTPNAASPVWNQDYSTILQQAKKSDASRTSSLLGVEVTASTRFAGHWSADYSETLKRSTQSGKPALVYFSGSNWCGFCKRLDSEILSTDDFKSYALEHFELANLDFPRPAPKGNRDHDLNIWIKEQHQVKGFPTLLVLNGNGAVLGQVGYVRGGPSEFIAALEAILDKQ